MITLPKSNNKAIFSLFYAVIHMQACKITEYIIVSELGILVIII